MSARKETYFVFPLANSWMLSTESELEAWGPYPTKARAVRMARAFAKINQPSEVIVRSNGSERILEHTGGKRATPPTG